MPHPTAVFALSIMQCSIKPNAVSKASSNFSSEEYRQCFRTKRRGVSPSPPDGGLLVELLENCLNYRLQNLSEDIVAVSCYIFAGNDTNQLLSVCRKSLISGYSGNF